MWLKTFFLLQHNSPLIWLRNIRLLQRNSNNPLIWLKNVYLLQHNSPLIWLKNVYLLQRNSNSPLIWLKNVWLLQHNCQNVFGCYLSFMRPNKCPKMNFVTFVCYKFNSRTFSLWVSISHSPMPQNGY